MEVPAVRGIDAFCAPVREHPPRGGDVADRRAVDRHVTPPSGKGLGDREVACEEISPVGEHAHGTGRVPGRMDHGRVKAVGIEPHLVVDEDIGLDGGKFEPASRNEALRDEHLGASQRVEPRGERKSALPKEGGFQPVNRDGRTGAPPELGRPADVIEVRVAQHDQRDVAQKAAGSFDAGEKALHAAGPSGIDDEPPFRALHEPDVDEAHPDPMNDGFAPFDAPRHAERTPLFRTFSSSRAETSRRR